jgi:SecD/SecF fusion protein
MIEQAIETIRNRIETLEEVTEPVIRWEGDQTIAVNLPGVTDADRAVSLITSPGQLSFRPVIDMQVDLPADQITSGDDPAQEAWLRGPGATGTWAYRVAPAVLTENDVAEASAIFSSSGNQWLVQLEFTTQGASRFQDMTRQAASFPFEDPRRSIAIVLDGEILSAPTVSLDVDPDVGIEGGEAIITIGSALNQQQEATDLAVVLRYGSFPIAFEIVSVSSSD